ncbi:DUF6538 domain-containing protein [Thauera humireducens]|uniref:DUF6538 domain-containing protein n=1 Tax=Thauera humireducens TaxID=1134435 RepID=UPI003C7609C1
MSYVTSHHGTLWFQIRVPSRLESLHGKVVRVNLQTRDPALAKVLSLRLAGEWLSRFHRIRCARSRSDLCAGRQPVARFRCRPSSGGRASSHGAGGSTAHCRR